MNTDRLQALEACKGEYREGARESGCKLFFYFTERKQEVFKNKRIFHLALLSSKIL